jgi:hypothetical protein
MNETQLVNENSEFIPNLGMTRTDFLSGVAAWLSLAASGPFSMFDGFRALTGREMDWNSIDDRMLETKLLLEISEMFFDLGFTNPNPQELSEVVNSQMLR